MKQNVFLKVLIAIEWYITTNIYLCVHLIYFNSFKVFNFYKKLEKGAPNTHKTLNKFSTLSDSPCSVRNLQILM